MEISTVFKIKTNVATQQPAYTCVLLLSTIFSIFNKLGIYVYIYTYIHYIYVYIIYIYTVVANNTCIIQHGEFFLLNNITFLTKHFYNI